MQNAETDNLAQTERRSSFISDATLQTARGKSDLASRKHQPLEARKRAFLRANSDRLEEPNGAGCMLEKT